MSKLPQQRQGGKLLGAGSSCVWLKHTKGARLCHGHMLCSGRPAVAEVLQKGDGLTSVPLQHCVPAARRQYAAQV